MEAHLFARTAPTRSETAHLVDFALRALRVQSLGQLSP